VIGTKSRWIKHLENVDSLQEIGDLIELFTNFASSKDCNKTPDKHTPMGAMVQKLYKEKQKNSHSKTGAPPHLIPQKAMFQPT
jgi:hypothetical protein